MKNGIKSLAVWLIIGVILIVVISSIMENSNSKMTYSELIENIEDGQEVILVDHNENTQSISNLSNAKILKVIDHHTMNFVAPYQLYYMKKLLIEKRKTQYLLNDFCKPPLQHHNLLQSSWRGGEKESSIFYDESFC